MRSNLKISVKIKAHFKMSKQCMLLEYFDKEINAID